MKKRKLLKSLSQDLIKLLETNDEYNAIIEAGEGPAMQSFKVHSVILCHRCPILYDEIKKVNHNENNIRVITKTRISATVFAVIINYIYSGDFNLENIKTSTIFDILITAEKYELTGLLQYLEAYMLKSKIAWLESNSFRANEAIFNCGSHGPEFGAQDIYMGETFNSVKKKDQCWYRFKNYEVKIRDTIGEFSIDEYE
ncbi:3707_t:CDS:2, partial [Acaulospora morrowiae]